MRVAPAIIKALRTRLSREAQVIMAPAARPFRDIGRITLRKLQRRMNQCLCNIFVPGVDSLEG